MPSLPKETPTPSCVSRELDSEIAVFDFNDRAIGPSEKRDWRRKLWLEKRPRREREKGGPSRTEGVLCQRHLYRQAKTGRCSDN